MMQYYNGGPGGDMEREAKDLFAVLMRVPNLDHGLKLKKTLAQNTYNILSIVQYELLIDCFGLIGKFI